MSPSLQQAIEGVYESFRDAPRPRNIGGCPHCIEDKNVDLLLATPLRQISAEDLSSYASSVFLTVGAVADYLYFLPRILEILAVEHGWWPNPEIVARNIDTAGFNDWPEHRQRAVRQYFDTAVDELLLVSERGVEIDSWICALAKIEPDIVLTLERVAGNRHALIRFFEWNSQSLLNDQLTSSFWEESDEAKIVAWFQSPAIRNAIQAAYGLA